MRLIRGDWNAVVGVKSNQLPRIVEARARVLYVYRQLQSAFAKREVLKLVLRLSVVAVIESWLCLFQRIKAPQKKLFSNRGGEEVCDGVLGSTGFLPYLQKFCDLRFAEPLHNVLACPQRERALLVQNLSD